MDYIDLHLTNLTDPIAYIGRGLAEGFSVRALGNTEKLEYGGMFDETLFEAFIKRYNGIRICSGLPRNDYGQTVTMYHISGALPYPESEEWYEIPAHLIGENLPLKSTEVTGRYKYDKKADTRHPVHAIVEHFYFEYAPGYKPDTFSKLNSLLSSVRYLSVIMHKLDFFNVELTSSGVHVKLRARTGNSFKPDFSMNH